MLVRLMIVVSIITSSLLSAAIAEETKPAYSMEGMSYPMQKSMDPQVWMKMMNMMMDPSSMTPMENCALCHEGDDLARYSEQFGPMMNSMHDMYKSVSPHQAMQYMNPMMGMMNPMMMGMMNPMMYMNMMGPMMGMMGPMMGMMGPMMNPMGMMNPMSMMGPMMNPMGMMSNPMGMMGNPMGMMGGSSTSTTNPMQMMDPKQYESWFNQMTEMMKSFTPAENK